MKHPALTIPFGQFDQLLNTVGLNPAIMTGIRYTFHNLKEFKYWIYNNHEADDHDIRFILNKVYELYLTKV